MIRGSVNVLGYCSRALSIARSVKTDSMDTQMCPIEDSSSSRNQGAKIDGAAAQRESFRMNSNFSRLTH